jgi:GMP synthase (glutamine-hydrolysing)
VTRKPGRLLVIQHESTGHLGQLADVCAAQRLAVDTCVVDAGDPVPSGLGDAAGLVVLGAVIGVGDAPEHPYLYRVMGLFREAAREGRPALGLCLGGQLAAAALGGRARAGSGLELGWTEVRATKAGLTDPVTGALGPRSMVFEWHKDELEPPPGAHVLLVGDRYPHQGFRLSSVWGFQPHLEIDRDLVALWCGMEEAPAHLSDAGMTAERLIHDTEARAGGARSALEAWVRLVATQTVPDGG